MFWCQNGGDAGSREQTRCLTQNWFTNSDGRLDSYTTWRRSAGQKHKREKQKGGGAAVCAGQVGYRCKLGWPSGARNDWGGMHKWQANYKTDQFPLIVFRDPWEPYSSLENPKSWIIKHKLSFRWAFKYLYWLKLRSWKNKLHKERKKKKKQCHEERHNGSESMVVGRLEGGVRKEGAELGINHQFSGKLSDVQLGRL